MQERAICKVTEFRVTKFHSNGLYSTLPICSFTLKAKLPKKHQPITKPTTLGEHIKKVRLKRNQQQQEAAKLLNVSSMYLSIWENNQKPPHPKYAQTIVDYLGYIPNITSKFERLGTRTQLYRMKYKLSIEEFLQMANMDIHVLMKLETMRHCKIDVNDRKAISRWLI